MAEYAHVELGTEVQSISGYYTIQEECRAANGGREFLYLVGAAVVDSSCCGGGGMRFLQIPGYIVAWKTRKNGEGLDVSEVEPVRRDEDCEQIKRMLDREYPGAQIIFF
jgi:hypothetical protein